ncbi:hypothetical protein GCM10009836_42610 [Pseudonocardia ailaonensis]|uniref:Luciferase-like domain-containing protein n=1 Tax=Pseudonocardia ailaonensis TaxID=367279 RepID=A0ABN2N9D6_9PSEU
MCFLALTSADPADWRAQVDSYKTAAREQYGREAQVWIMATIVQRNTNAEADAALRRIAVDQADHDSVEAWMQERALNSKGMSAQTRDVLRLRAAAGAGGSILCGDAERVADQIQVVSDAGIDGVLVGYVDFEDGLGRLAKDLLPLLEQRGLREPFAPLG